MSWHKSAKLKRIVGATSAVALGVTLSVVGLSTAANAATATPGHYNGMLNGNTNPEGRQVDFDVSADGVVTNFDTVTYTTCIFGNIPSTVPFYWPHDTMTPIQIGADGTWTDDYYLDTDEETYVQFHSEGKVEADGTISGYFWADMVGPGMVCSGNGDTFVAKNTAPVAQPKITATPTAVTVSELGATGVAISGTEYPANAAVTVNLDGTQAATATTDATGNFSTTVTRAGVAPGAHTIAAVSGTANASTSITVNADPIVYNPTITVNPASIATSDLANTGTTVTGAGYPADAVISITIGGANAGGATADANGAFTATAKTSLAPGTYTVTAADGAGRATADGSLTVTADPIVYNPTIAATPASVTVADLAAPGVTVNGTGYPANATITLTMDGTAAGTAFADANGAFSATVARAGVAVGAHTITATDGTNSADTSITVTADPVNYDPAVTATPASLTVSELASTGTTVAGTGYPANAAITLTLDGAAAGTATADANGAFTATVVQAGVAAGSHTIIATDGTNSANTSITVTADPVVYDPEIVLTPASLTVSELASTGTSVEGSGFPANAAITLTIDGAAAGTATADADGAFTATVVQAGVTPGAHTVSASDGDVNRANATVSVTADPIVYTPEIAVDPTTLTVSEMATSGATVSGKGYPANAAISLTLDGEAAGSATADADGAFTAVVKKAGVAAGEHAIVATDGTNSANASVSVTADPEPTEPIVSTSVGEITAEDLAGAGVVLTGSGFPAGETVTITFDGETVGTAVVGDDGTFTFTVVREGVAAGDHTIVATAGDVSAEVSVKVTEEPQAPATVALSVNSITTKDLGTTGIVVTGAGFEPDTAVSITLDSAAPKMARVGVAVAAAAADEVTTDAEGNFAATFTYSGAKPGAQQVVVTVGAETVSSPLTVEADAQSINVTPESISIAALGTDGVLVEVRGLTPEAAGEVRFDDELLEAITIEADGSVTGTVFVTNATAGEHTITVADGTSTLSATIVVTTDGGTNPTPTPTPTPTATTTPVPTAPPVPTPSPSWSTGPTLPVTGSDSTAMTIGASVAALLLAGGIAVVAAGAKRRRLS